MELDSVAIGRASAFFAFIDRGFEPNIPAQWPLRFYRLLSDDDPPALFSLFRWHYVEISWI